MFALIIGGGKVGFNLSEILIEMGNEVMLVERRPERFNFLKERLEESVMYGDGTEIYVLEQGGIERADVVVAVTGDDEDNIIVSQLAKEKYGVQKTIARVNNPRNQQTFDLLGIAPTVSSTAAILSLIEHEVVPADRLVHLLTLREQNLEIVEAAITGRSPAKGKEINELNLPEGILIISILRGIHSIVPSGSTVLIEGDRVLAILSPGMDEELRNILVEAAK
ncbi:MAG: NAD-binding protein [Actinobacteria bacterium]|nr:NAD-binding protein [Actinomycetota bacterium]